MMMMMMMMLVPVRQGVAADLQATGNKIDDGQELFSNIITRFQSEQFLRFCVELSKYSCQNIDNCTAST